MQTLQNAPKAYADKLVTEVFQLTEKLLATKHMNFASK